MNEDEKLKMYFETEFEIEMNHNPIAATYFGYKHEKYDHLLPDGSINAKEDDIIRLLQQKRKLKTEIDYKALSEEGKLDYDLLEYFLDSQDFQINELAFWKGGIDTFLGSPIGAIATAIYVLYSRDFAPLDTRISAIISRLKATPRYLEETKSTWIWPVDLWVNLTLEEGPRTIGFLQLIQHTVEPNIEPELHQELAKEINNVSKVINEYMDWINSEILPRAHHDWVIGSQKFTRLLELRKLGKTSDEILKIGEKALKDTKKELEELAKELYPDKTVKEVREIIKGNHPPTFEMVLEHVRELAQDAREFISKKNLMTIPEGEDLQVSPTPSFLIPIIPFAAYNSPEKFSDNQIGQYIVTPIEGREEMLREHSYASCKNVAVHEAYPGHHLQLTASNLQPSLIRTIVQGNETVEGWAHYCEQLMAEKGFLGKDEVFMQRIDQLWRAVRIIVDIKMHTGRMSFDEARAFMVQEIGMDENAVIAELKRYTFTPGYQLSYLFGKFLLLDLRDYVKEKLGDRYSDQFFHNTILDSGGIPIHFLKRLFEIRVDKMLNN
ncbi:MAG: DUF885 domain-containing protein [Candidatus Heimdallarchaeota archaeon]|nr:MAG: DUF885 domain-containing protein [Candidatus Heimdallarchaeota archaeon]